MKLTVSRLCLMKEGPNRQCPSNSSERSKKTMGLYNSCRKHAMRPNLSARGNIFNHTLNKRHFNFYMKYKKKVHLERGCGQFYPSEIRTIRSHLMTSSDPSDWQTYIMILIGIKCFLRMEEILELEVADFIHSWYPVGKHGSTKPAIENALTKCQVFSFTDLESIGFEIQGKSDLHPVRLMIFRDRICPEFDLLLHILWYMKTLNIKGGKLFLPGETIRNQYKNGCTDPLVCTKNITKSAFKRRLKNLIPLCGRENREFLIGTHTLRKTAYLFAVWGFFNGLKLGS